MTVEPSPRPGPPARLRRGGAREEVGRPPSPALRRSVTTYDASWSAPSSPTRSAPCWTPHASARVLVVTDEVALAGWLAGLGVAAIPDASSDDLNETLAQGAAELLRRDPGPPSGRRLRRPARPPPRGALGGPGHRAAGPCRLRRRRRRGRDHALHGARPRRPSSHGSASAPGRRTAGPAPSSWTRQRHRRWPATSTRPTTSGRPLELGVGNRTSFVLTAVGLDRG